MTYNYLIDVYKFIWVYYIIIKIKDVYMKETMIKCENVSFKYRLMKVKTKYAVNGCKFRG